MCALCLFKPYIDRKRKTKNLNCLSTKWTSITSLYEAEEPYNLSLLLRKSTTALSFSRLRCTRSGSRKRRTNLEEPEEIDDDVQDHFITRWTATPPCKFFCFAPPTCSRKAQADETLPAPWIKLVNTTL